MKNNFLKYILIILFTFLNIPSFSDDLIFETETINITNKGDLTIAKNGKVNFKNENLEITGEIFEYYNNKKMLTVFEAMSFLMNDDIKIKSNKIVYDRNKLLLIASGEVELENLRDNSTIFTEELIFDNNLKKIISKKSYI